MKHFDYECRVRYGDTDKMGVSYYANYLFWFEAARTEYFRALGLPYTECEKKGYFLPVSDAGIKYHSPSTYDDLIVVRTSVAEIRKSSLRFEYQTFHKESNRLLATGFTKHVFVGRDLKPVRMPNEIESAVEICKILEV